MVQLKKIWKYLGWVLQYHYFVIFDKKQRNFKLFMTKYSLLSLFIFILGSFASAQHSTKEAFEVQVEWTNPDSEINNGKAKKLK